MLQKFYTRFIHPRSVSPDLANRELVLNFVFLGVILLALASLLNTLVSLIMLREKEFIGRALVIGIFSMVLIGIYAYSRAKQKHTFAAISLLGVFFLAACLVVYQWGILTPIGPLLFGLVIVMAGILLNSRSALYAAGITALVMGFFGYVESHKLTSPDISWSPANANMGDVVGFYGIFAIIALVSWLFNHQMEQSLKRAQKSEAALSRQKALLEIKVEERTRELEVAQVEKMKQVYRFAELGRVSSALFHDLANHLTSVSLDIEGLEPKGRSKIMQRIQQDIHYIDDVVQRVRFQLRGQSEIERFNVMKEINRVIKIMTYQTIQAQVVIEAHRSGNKPIYYTGDITRFRQLINNLLSNAVEAYPAPKTSLKKPRVVELHIEQTDKSLVVRVKDRGVGIKKSQQAKVFEPFFTNKHDGTGIGLFIVKQIAEQDLKGTIQLASSPEEGTEFIVTLPLTL